MARRFLPLLGLAFFAVALWILHRALREFHFHDILRHLEAIPADRLLLALVLTLLNYLVLTAYDRLGVRYLRHPLPPRRVTLAAFISYAFSNTLGLSLLTAGSIRYRLYSAWGLSAEEIARLVAFTMGTFWLGLLTVGGAVSLIAPVPLEGVARLPLSSARGTGICFLALVAAYLLLVGLRGRPLRIRGREIPLPTLREAGLQLAVGSFDWVLAGFVLYSLLPSSAGLAPVHFLEVYLLAQMAGLVSNVPGGLGVFETVLLLLLPGLSPAALLGSLLAFRGIYYLLPFGMAVLLLGGLEAAQHRGSLSRAGDVMGRWLSALVPSVLSGATLVAGAVLLFSGATPAVPERVARLRDFLPLPLLEISHFLGSLTGAVLLLLARGLQRRLDAAYLLTLGFLVAGIAFSLLKGGDYEEAALLTVMLVVLIPCRRHFYRRASLLREPFTPGWTAAIAVVLGTSLWLKLFSYKHVDYARDLWWTVAFRADAPRSLRAEVGAAVFLLLFAAARLGRPARPAPSLPGPEELAKAARVVRSSHRTVAHLALLGDKALLFSDSGKGFLMYGVEGRSWVCMGGPVGPEGERRELAWRFRGLCERYGGWPVFYEVGTEELPLCLDMGLALLKIGEEARVALAGFSLEGSARSTLRQGHRRAERAGCVFEIVPAEGVPPLIPELRGVSDAWLSERNTREKGFSLGFFHPSYLACCPVAVVRRGGEIVAFANLWLGAGKEELSVDLMRFRPDVPHGMMDYLFVSLMLWGKGEGYRWFNLGMAPLAGLETPLPSPLWNRIGALVFRHGEHFYNFQGLRDYKDKFGPVWDPRYLAAPGGIALPRVLAQVAILISEGLRGIFGK